MEKNSFKIKKVELQLKQQLERFKQEARIKKTLTRPFSQDPVKDENKPEVIIDDGSMFLWMIIFYRIYYK